LRNTHSELLNAECGFRIGGQFTDKKEMQRRTKEFALAIIELTGSLPRGTIATVIAGQLLRSGTSVGANYRAACRAKAVPHDSAPRRRRDYKSRPSRSSRCRRISNPADQGGTV